MAKYLFVYYGKWETDPKKVAKSMDAWGKWFAGLGKAVVDGGAPLMPGKIVSAAGIKSPRTKLMTGYSIMQAANMDAALKMAKSCPGITAGQDVAVYELAPM